MKNLNSENSYKILSKDEMRSIIGGYMSIDSCSAQCKDGTSVSCSGSSCTAHDHGHEFPGVEGSFNDGDGFCYNDQGTFTKCT